MGRRSHRDRDGRVADDVSQSARGRAKLINEQAD